MISESSNSSKLEFIDYLKIIENFKPINIWVRPSEIESLIDFIISDNGAKWIHITSMYIISPSYRYNDIEILGQSQNPQFIYKDQYNQIISLIEDMTGKSIEELSDGHVYYITEGTVTWS